MTPAPDSLPDDAAALRAALAAEQPARREAEARAAGAEAMVAHLKLLIAQLKRDKYGASSERGRKLIDQLELELGELVAAASEDAAKAENAAGKEVAALQSRQQYLATLAEQRCGAAPPVAVQTVQMAASAPAVVSTANGPQTYRGKGSTDAWCQSPAMVLTINGEAVEGLLSENSNNTPTSTVKGAVSNGQLTLSFTGSGPDYFTGDATGTQTGDSIRIAFRTKTTKACNYTFDLRPASAASPTELLR